MDTEAAVAKALGEEATQDKNPATGNAQATQQTQLTQPQTPSQNTQADGQAQNQADGTATGTFTVTEARATKSHGVVRAYCLAEDGSKVAVYGKNGNGQVLAGAVGKRVEIKYRQGDKGLIALSVRLAG